MLGGNLVNIWENSETRPGASVYLLENGNLLRTGRISSNFNGGGTGGRLEMFSWDDELLWRYDYTDSLYHHHHDVAVLPNGNILLIAWELHSKLEAINAGRDSAVGGANVWSERVVEIKPVGTDEIEVVWEWHLWDHLIQDFDPSVSNFGVVADHPELMNINAGTNAIGNNQDWIHFNAINYNQELDQIILSSRHLNEIYIIDHSTTTTEAASHNGGNSEKGGDFLFRWGNPLNYDRGTEIDQQLYGQHDARWIPAGYPNEGKIMVFNNGIERPDSSYSTVDMIQPPLENDNTYAILAGEPFAPAGLFWTYVADPPTSLYSANISGAHLLPNGNTMICEGRFGNFYEVTEGGEIVWYYKLPIGNNGPVSQGTPLMNTSAFRVTRYGENYPAFVGKDLTPGDPIELNPLPSDCEIYNLPVAVKNLNQLKGVNVLNNPIHDFLFIKNKTNDEVIIDVFDLTGRKINQVSSFDENLTIHSHEWKSGVYFVRVLNRKQNQVFIQKIIKI